MASRAAVSSSTQPIRARISSIKSSVRLLSTSERSTYTNGVDVRWTPERGKQKTIDPPAGLATNATDVDKENFKVDVSKYVKRRNRLRANPESAFTFILGQCTKLTRMQLEGLPTWEAVDDSSDMIKLINMVQGLSHQTTNQKYYPLYLYMAKKIVYGLQQPAHDQHTTGQ